MPKCTLYLACILAFAGCINTDATSTGDTASSSSADGALAVHSRDTMEVIKEEPEGDELMVFQGSITEERFERWRWIDTLAGIAVKSSDNPLIQYAVNDSSITWLWDRLEPTDTACYVVLHLGHEFQEEDDGGLRFVTDGWLYIDTLTRAVYEYDIPNERFIKLSIPVVDTLADDTGLVTHTMAP